MVFCSIIVFAGVPMQASNAVSKRVDEITKLIDSGDRKTAKTYITKNYSPTFLKIPLSEHLNFISRVYEITRGIESYHIDKTNPENQILLLQSKLTHTWIALSICIEPNTPYRIEGINFSKPPENIQHISKQLSHAEIATEIKNYLQKLADADVFSGTVLIAKNGEPFYEGAFGFADKNFNVPNKIDTKFNLGSMNKMFTAVAIAQLVEGGALSYDDSLSKFLPDFPNKADAKKIQIKHLLTHTSGLGSYFNKKFTDSSRALFRTVDDMMFLVKDEEKLAFEPGTKWQYSNTGFLVLGKVIEKVTGESYYDYVWQHIYQPVNMNHTDSYELDLVNPNLAVGYDKEFTSNGIVYKNNLFEHVIRGSPAGGGYSTVEDLLKFDKALRTNKIIDATQTALLLTPKPELNSPNYGYGFEFDPEHNMVGHGGGFSGISVNLGMNIKNGYTVIVLSNYSHVAQFVAMRIVDLLPYK